MKHAAPKHAAPSTPDPLDPRLLLTAPPTWVFKQDRRSRVWRIDSARGPLVIKRFEYSPPRQTLAGLVRAHPAQREMTRNAELRQKGVRVVPILAAGRQPHPLGCRFWLVTPWIGKSFQQISREGALTQDRRRRAALAAVADLTADLIKLGYANRDHKVSNMIMDKDAKLHLIDVGAVRRARRRRSTLGMLAMLLKTLALEGVGSNERLACLRTIHRRCRFLGPLRKLAHEVDQVSLP